VHKVVVGLSRLHTSKFSLTSFDLANFICWCVKKNLSHFSLTSAEFASPYGSTRKPCQRKYGNCGRTAVLLLWVEYRIVVNGKSCENVPHLILLVLVLNCLQNLETDFVFALPEGEPTTSDSCLFECSNCISKAQPRPPASNLFFLVK